MEEKREQALGVIAKMLSPVIAETMANPQQSLLGFAKDMGALALENVFENIWTRPGLDARTRSIVTVSLLIALRSEFELSIHIPAAVRNGVSVEEIEEILYHATAYAGFPAAASARAVAEKSLREAGMIE